MPIDDGCGSTQDAGADNSSPAHSIAAGAWSISSPSILASLTLSGTVGTAAVALHAALPPPTCWQAMYVLSLVAAAWSACTQWAIRWLPPPAQGQGPKVDSWQRIVIVGAAFVIFALSYRNGHVLFAAYDCAPNVDVAWRIACGQRPIVDFPCPFPPAFYLFAAACFEVMGPSWHSLVLPHAILAASFFCWFAESLFRLTRQFGVSIMLATSVVSAGMCLHGFAYHTCLYTMAYGGTVLSLFMLLQTPSSRWAQISLFWFIAFLAWNKPLWVLSLPLLWPIASWIWDCTRVSLVVISLGAAVTSLLGLLACGVDVSRTLAAYSAASGRLNPLETLGVLWNAYPQEWAVLVGASIVAGLLSAALYLRAETRRGRGIACMVILITGGSTYASAMSGEFPMAYLVVAPLACMAGHRIVVDSSAGRSSLDETIHRGNLLLGIFFLCAALLLGVGRARVWGAGPFYEWKTWTQARRCSGGFFLGSVISNHQQHIDELVNKLVEEVGSDKKFFFATRLEYLYALAGVQSPLGLPLWWHPGTSYAIQDSDVITANFFNHRFDFIVHMYDLTGLTPEICQAIYTATEGTPFGKEWGVVYRDETVAILGRRGEGQ